MKNNSPIYKRFIVSLMSGLLLFQNIVYASPAVTDQGSTTSATDGKSEAELPKEKAKDGKASTKEGDSAFVNSKSALSSSFGKASISATDLSANYSIGILSTNMYPEKVNSGMVFALSASYNSNNSSNNWGIGTGFSLNIPTLSFDPDWVKTCKGDFNDKGECEGKETTIIKTKGVSGFPKTISYSASGSGGTFKQETEGATENKVTYIPILANKSNFMLRIIATRTDKSYEFEVRGLNAKNTYTKFKFNGNAATDIKKPSTGEVMAVRSETYDNSVLPMRVDYQNDGDLTKGLVIFGASKTANQAMKLNNIYPNYELFNQVMNDSTSKDGNIGCYVYAGEHKIQVEQERWKDGFLGDKYRFNIWDSIPHYAKVTVDNLPKDVYYDNCPETAFNLLTHPYSTITPRLEPFGGKDYSKTVDGINLNNKAVTVALTLDNMQQVMDNLLSDGGQGVRYENGGGALSGVDWHIVKNRLYYVVIAKSQYNLRGSIAKLTKIQWSSNTKSDIQSMDLTYGETGLSVSHLSVIGQNYYGLTGSNRAIPLLTNVSGRSAISPVTQVNFTYAEADYKSYYTMTTMVGLGNEDNLTKVLNHYKNELDTKDKSPASSKFKYATTITVSSDTGESISTNYRFGDAHNIHSMYDKALTINLPDSETATNTDVIRGGSNFFATTAGLKDSDNKVLSPADLKDVEYSVINSDDKTLSKTTYNRYGLPKNVMTCPADYVSDTSKCDIVQVEYAHDGPVYKNQDLAPNDGKLAKPYDLVYSVTYTHGSIPLYSVKPKYDSMGRPSVVGYYNSDGKLTSATKTQYSDNGSPSINGYFDTTENTSYSEPFIKTELTDLQSKIFTKTNYSYKIIKVGEQEYAVLERESSNISGSRYGTKVYDYESDLRLKQTMSCVDPANAASRSYPSCSITDAPGRYKVKNSIEYKDDSADQRITTTSSTPGSGQEVMYYPGTGLVHTMITADGTKEETKYDDFGRATETKSGVFSKTSNEPKIISHSTIAYTPTGKNDNSLKVETTDLINNNKSLVYYNDLGQQVCAIGPNLNIKLSDGTPLKAGQLGNRKVVYSYNKQGQQSKVELFAKGSKPLECGKTQTEDGSILLSSVTNTYDYMGRVVNSTTDIPAIGDRKRYQTKTEYEYGYEYSASKTALWFKLQASKMITSTKQTKYVKYDTETAWRDEGSSTVKNDVLKHITTNIVKLPTTSEKTVSTVTTTYDKDSDSRTIVSHSSALGAPDSEIAYDKLGRISTNTVMDSNGGNKQVMSYHYDDLDRPSEVVLNDKVLPYSVIYDDNGLETQQIYNYKDANQADKNRLTDYIYKDVCLLPSAYASNCQKDAFKTKQLDRVNLYANATKSGKVWTPEGSALKYTEYAYNDYSLVTTVTTHGNGKQIIDGTSYDDKLRVSENSYTDENNKRSSIKYHYSANGMPWSQELDQGTGRVVTNYSGSNDENATNEVVENREQSVGVKPDDKPIDFKTTSNIDPGIGWITSSQFANQLSDMYSTKYDHTTNYTYDNLGRLTTVTKMANSAAPIYSNKTYAYCNTTSDTCLYGDIVSVRENFVSKSAPDYVEENYQYDPVTNKLTQRGTVLNKSKGAQLTTTEGYVYDSLYRLSHYTCSGSKTNLCSSDLLSGNKPIKSRDYTYTAANDIQTIATINSSGTSYNHTFNYGNNNQLTSVVDGSQRTIYSLTYDAVMAWVSNYAQQDAKTPRDVDYTYNLSGLLEKIDDKQPNGVIDISHGIGGINRVDYMNQQDKAARAKRQYLGGGLYTDDGNKDYAEKTHLGVGGAGSADDYLNLSGNEIQEQLKGLNGRVIASAFTTPGTDVMLNNYTPYGQANANRVSNTGAILPDTDHSRLIMDGENGAYTILGSYKANAEQYQVLGSRIYMPGIGRFLEHDSISPFGAGGPNGYMYGSGNPVGFADPSGHYGSMFTNGQTNSFNSEYAGNPVDRLVIDIVLGIFAVTTTALSGGALAPLWVGLEVASSTLAITATSIAVANYGKNDTITGKNLSIASAAIGAVGIIDGIYGLSKLPKALKGKAASKFADDAGRLAAREGDIHTPCGPEGCGVINPQTGKAACFTAGTKVSAIVTENGKEVQGQINIESIQLGMLVPTVDTDKLDIKPVAQIHNHIMLKTLLWILTSVLILLIIGWRYRKLER
jgi:RHS repeat-associated protein